MKWLENWNEALCYIEENLDKEISYQSGARIACCSTYYFQRMFSYVTGTTLSEYIRRRRMTLAATDLSKGAKVIDVAVKYGYESPTSFNRAFQSVHGISPSLAQKEGADLKAYLPIRFNISIRGDVEMKYKLITTGKIRIVGKKIGLDKDMDVNFKRIPEFWSEVTSDPKNMETLCKIMDGHPQGLLGVNSCYEEDWQYFIAVSSSKELPEGMEEYVIPESTWAVFSGTGTMPESVQALLKQVMTEWIPGSGYEFAETSDMEVYKNQDPQHAEFEIWMPVRKKTE